MTNDKLPLPIHQAIPHLRTKDNLKTIGLFRKTPSITLLDTLKAAYDSSIPIRLQNWPDNAILAGSILKTYLRNMQHPVFPSSLYGMIRNCPVKEEEAAAYVKDELLPALQEQHPDGELVFALLEGILQLLKDVAALKGTRVSLLVVIYIDIKSVMLDFNQMDSHNLAVVFLPVLVRSADIRQDAMICTMPRRIDPNQRNSTTKPEETGSLGAIIKLCIERYDEIFPLACHGKRESTNDSSSYAITPVTSRSASATSASSTVSPLLLRIHRRLRLPADSFVSGSFLCIWSLKCTPHYAQKWVNSKVARISGDYQTNEWQGPEERS